MILLDLNFLLENDTEIGKVEELKSEKWNWIAHLEYHK